MQFLDNHFRLYGGSTESDADFARRFNAKVNNKIGMLSSGFGQQIQALDNMFNSQQAIMRSQLIASQIETVMKQDHIFEVTRDNYRMTNETMKRYIVSHPKIYRKVRKQSMDGYQNSGFELFNNMKDPRQREDYMQVIGSGIIDSKTIIEEEYITSRNPELNPLERTNIYKSWLNVLDGLGDDIDMTDI